MAEAITPVVHGGRARWIGALVLHVGGAAVAAGAFGATLAASGAALGAPFGRAGLLVAGGVAAAYALAAVPGSPVRIPIPQLRRQVPDWWRTYFSPPVTALLYGLGLGVGFATFLATGALVVVAVASSVSGSPLVGALLMVPFGLARGAPALVAHGVQTPVQGHELVTKLAARRDVARRWAAVAALTFVAVSAGVGATRMMGIDASAGGWPAVGSAALAVVFTWSAVSKLAGKRRWRRVLVEHPLPDPLRRVAISLVPAGELVVPLLALVGARRVSALWGLGLVVVFTAEAAWVRTRTKGAIACGCFGGRRAVSFGHIAIRNGVLLFLAGVVVVTVADSSIAMPDVPAGTDIVPFAFAVVGLGAAVAVAWRSAVWSGRGRA